MAGKKPTVSGMATHIPILENLCKNYKFKTIVEFGMGNYSTRLFLKQKCYLRSIETSEKWYKNVVESADYITKFKWDAILTNCEIDRAFYFVTHYPALFLIDSADYANRYRFAEIAMDSITSSGEVIIVIHDTEEKLYNYHKINLRNNILCDVMDFPIWTGVISRNKLDCISEFEKIKIYNNDTIKDKLYLR